ncbi:MAG: glycosyltransferase family 1 protein [Alistipes sp.]
MKGLFLVFHGISAHSGISKKIAAQCQALCRCGVTMQLCYLRVMPDGARQRLVDECVIADFGGGVRGRVLHRVCFDDVVSYVRTHGIDFLYVRYDHNPTPFTIHFLREMKREKVQIALEIPTYPYDCEARGQALSIRFKLFIDRCFRQRFMRYVDRIVTFSDDEQIFGCPTIRISNGVDFSQIPLVHAKEPTADFYLLGVANIHAWHGFDRVLAGLAVYYRQPQSQCVRFILVGDGDSKLLDAYRNTIRESGLESYVEITGPLAGDALDAVFNRCDLGVGSLARHRSGIQKIRTLKNREYAARGIPFIYSECDDDFDLQPYVMKIAADESPLDIEAVVRFRQSLSLTPAAIRATVEGALSWDRQMEQVVQQMDRI